MIKNIQRKDKAEMADKGKLPTLQEALLNNKVTNPLDIVRNLQFAATAYDRNLLRAREEMNKTERELSTHL